MVQLVGIPNTLAIPRLYNEKWQTSDKYMYIKTAENATKKLTVQWPNSGEEHNEMVSD
jgi:hypothetical protein